MVVRSILAPALAVWAAGCATRPPTADPGAGPKPLERHEFRRPKANFNDAVDAVARHWYDRALDVEAIHEHSWLGLLKELSFQDAETSARLAAEVRGTTGRARLQQGMAAVRRAWGRGRVDDETLHHYALAGLLRELSWDGEMLQAWPPKYAKAAKEQLGGQTESIGLDFRIRKDKLIVTDVVPESPADEAGIRPGDRILAIDDDFLSGKGLRDFYELIRKPAGSRVQLIVSRGETNYRLNLACRRFNARDVRSEVVAGAGIIRVLHFSAQSIEDFPQQLAALGFRNVKGLVLDLRSSGGGYAAAVSVMACPFLSRGTTLYYETGRDGIENAVTCPSGSGIEVPLGVLINSETNSAGELLAAALKDSGRASLVGTKTKGYGATKNNVSLENGYTFRIIVATNAAPGRQALLASGVSPHRPIELAFDEIEGSRLEPTVERRLERDAQLSAAISRLAR